MPRERTLKYGGNKNNWYDSKRQNKKMIFATVDKSPHCIQLHYIIKELENAIDISNIEITNYVAVDNKLIGNTIRSNKFI